MSVLTAALVSACAADSGRAGGGSGAPDRGRGEDTDRGRPDTSGEDDSGVDPPDVGASDTRPEEETPVVPDASPIDSSVPFDTATDFTPIDIPSGPTSTISGTVWAPGNAPGMVPSGQEIPIYNAIVYLSLDRADPIPQGAYCEACEATPSRATWTDHNGNFVIPGWASGTFWLTIQKGQFRVEQQITIPPGVELDLPAEQTTLPSRHDPDNGRWIPRIALATGSYDHLEDIFGKMGMGASESSGSFDRGSAAGVFDCWGNGGGSCPGADRGSFGDLVRDLHEMLNYHIIFVPCSGDSNTDALRDVNVLRNIRNYVSQGGNFYVTDWSGEWNDNVFPASITLGDMGTDTPGTAYNSSADTWNTFQFGSADGSSYDSEDGEAVDPDLHAWLDGQRGPTAESDTVTTYDPSRFYVEGNWNFISTTSRVQVGTDSRGDPIYDQAHVFVEGSNMGDIFGGGGSKHPLTVSYEPVGCGRVIYSTYHTTDDTHVGLVPQERVLLYLIMEIGTCRDPKQ